MKDLNSKIRFGVMASCDTMEWWQQETIKLLIDNGIELVITACDIDVDTARNLDFILSFKSEKIDENIISSPKNGVWEFHFQAFHDFMNKIPKSEVILRQLTDETSKCLIIKRLNLDTILHSYKAHRDRLYKEAEILPLLACKDLIVNGKLKTELSGSPIIDYPKPNMLQMIKYHLVSIWRRIVFHFNYFCRQEDWNVGFCMMPIADFINRENRESLDIQWLKPSKSEYFADPFVITTKDDTYLFFEWFSNKNGKADIAMAKQSEGFAKYHKTAHFPEHHSFPYIFEYQDVIYCIPEANKTDKISLYRLENDKLIFDTDLLQGRFVDSVLHHHKDGKWYLFTTPQKQSHTHLLIYLADDLRGPYSEHFYNPVKVDCHDSRMAGMILNIDGNLIRPAQNSTRHYGESVTLNKVIELNEYQYIEKEIKEIKPDKNWVYNKGIHTINGNDFMTVFDAKRFTFTLRGFIQQIRQKFEIC